VVTRQFDVLQNPSPTSRNTAPYGVVLQSHSQDAIDTVVVAPLSQPHLLEPDGALSLRVELDGEVLIAVVALIANTEARRLTVHVGDLRQYQDDIRRALRRLFSGF
jgi:toxin CcdB